MAVDNFVKSIRNIMRNDAGINGDAQRIEQLVWILFLKIYDRKEEDWEVEQYDSIIPDKYRWRNWAKDTTGKGLTGDELLNFVNNELFPTLKNLNVTPNTPIRKAIVKTIFAEANNYMKDGVLLRQVINYVEDNVNLDDYKQIHAFGDIYESILKEIQSAGAAGEFYTPRALTDFMAEMINPKLGETMADFACGTGGFITSWLKCLEKQKTTAQDVDLFNNSVFGIEKKPFPYMLCVTNLLLHGLENPKIKHDNALTKNVLNYEQEDKVDVVLMNPPYGGSEKEEIKGHFPGNLTSAETADLFIVLIMYRLKQNGRAAIILPDGFLFGTGNKQAIKEKLLKDFNLHTIIRLPGSVFAPYTSIATNILFFDNAKADAAPEGFATKQTWFYRLDMPKGYKHFSKTKPMLIEHLEPIKQWWNNRKENYTEDNQQSRVFSVSELMESNCNFDRCKYPKHEEVILEPKELLTQYFTRRKELEKNIDESLSKISAMLGIDINTIK